MKKTKILTWAVALMSAAFFMISADHIDAPAVTDAPTDITDFYAFQNSDGQNLVFVINTQGLLSPASTGDATFSESTLFEINIDTDGDNIEDLVVQAIPRADRMYVFGPVEPTQTGLTSSIQNKEEDVSVDITTYGSPAISSLENGISLFAGPRDDPFYFDLGAYSDVLSGSSTGFNDPGTDTFAGTNVMSIVIEIPKALLGNTSTINTWVESKVKQ